MLQHVVPRVVASELELYPTADIRVAIAPRLPAVMSSEHYLAHTMRNLLDHAMRYSPDGVVVLMDLGSALLSAETALEFLSPEQRASVVLCAAPLVEGALASRAWLRATQG